MLGTAGLMTLAGSTPASAFFFGKKAAPATAVDFSGLPADWVARQGTALKDYAGFIAGLKLDRLTARQVIDAHAKRRGSVWNSLPPKSMWKHMAPTLKVVDRVASELDSPVREIVSAYRSPAYNARCPGARRGSWHQANVAIDVRFAARPSTVSSIARQLRGGGKFSGGIGRYSNFTHIDTRGENADW